MKECDKINKLLLYIEDNYYKLSFTRLMIYANNNNLIDTLKKYDKLFIKAFEDMYIEKDTERWSKEQEEWEDKILETFN